MRLDEMSQDPMKRAEQLLKEHARIDKQYRIIMAVLAVLAVLCAVMVVVKLFGDSAKVE
jgi:hypothetical protein